MQEDIDIEPGPNDRVSCARMRVRACACFPLQACKLLMVALRQGD